MFQRRPERLLQNMSDSSQRSPRAARSRDLVAARLARGCLRWTHRHARSPHPDHMQELSELRGIELASHDALAHAVSESRAAGHTWSDIGRALGMTRQAAHGRFTSG